MSDRIKKYTPETFKAALEQQQEYNYYNRVNGQIEEVALEYEEKDRKQRETYQKCEQTKIDNKAKKEDLNNIRNVFQKELNAINKELEPLLEEYKMAESAMSVGYGDAFDRNYEKIKELSPKIKELESKKAILEPFIYSCDQQLKMSKYDYLNEDVNIVNYMNEYKKNGYNIFNIDWEKARDCDPSIDTKENPLNRLAVVEYLISTAPEDIDFENIKRNNPRIGGMLVNGEIIDYFDLYQFLTEEERAKYHYLFEHEGIDVATQYIIDMQDTFNQRQGQAEAEKFLNSLDYTDEGKLKQSISNYFGVSVEGLGDGIDSFWEGIDKIIMADGVLSSDDYRKIYVLQGLQEKSDILDGVYQFSSSLGNMAPTLVASAVITYCTKNPELGAKIASMLMGASAGGNAREQALAGGSDQLSAALYAIFTGLSEATLGYYLGKIPGISQTSGFTLSNILQEGTEEYLQTYIDAGLQAVILGNDIDWNEIPKEAQKSFIMGMLMSGFLNGGQSIVNVTINGNSMNIDIEKTLEYMENNPDVSVIDAIEQINNVKLPDGGLYNKDANNFFENSGAQYGVDQGIINSLSSYEYNGKTYSYHDAMAMINEAREKGLPIPKFTEIHSQEYYYQQNKLTSMGFSSNDAAVILECIDDAGACSYADVCNQIFYQYRNNPEKFEKEFGYPMYKEINGEMSLNSTDLLLDMYLYVNSVENGGSFILDGNKINPDAISDRIDASGRNLLKTEEQVDLANTQSNNTAVINSFLQSKNETLRYEDRFIGTSYFAPYLSKESMDQKVNLVLDEMDAGKSISMHISKFTANDTVIHLNSFDESTYESLSTANWPENMGHAVTITDVADNGFVVSTYGNKYIIPFEDLMNGGKFEIYSTEITDTSTN